MGWGRVWQGDWGGGVGGQSNTNQSNTSPNASGGIWLRSVTFALGFMLGMLFHVVCLLSPRVVTGF